MHVSERALKEFILDSGLVSRKDLEAALETADATGRSLGDVLVSGGHLSADALRRLKCYVLGIPFVNLKDRTVPLDVLSLVPEPIARAHGIIAYQKEGANLEVAFLDIEDLPLLEPLRKKTGLRILPRLTDDASATQALRRYQQALKQEFGDVIAAEAGKLAARKDAGPLEGAELRQAAEDLPVVRIVDTLLRHAVIQRASDIHVEPLEDQVLVRYRIDGMLRDAMALPRQAAGGIAARLKVLAGLPVGETHLPQDGRFKMETEKDKVSFRVSTLPTYYGEKIVLRLLREAGEGFTLEALGFHGEGLERVHAAVKSGTGLILIAGPSGSGKTTTLYTLLDILNAPDVNISTIEDPIEYQLKRVSQTQVNVGVGFTAAAGLRSLLRQDTDIIAVGELRDGETAALAVNAALSGRLVLATMNASSAADAILRIVEMGVEPFLLSSALKAVIGQRLARRLCEEKDEQTLSAKERSAVAAPAHFAAAFAALKEEKLVKAAVSLDAVPFYAPVSSAACEDGYAGRIGLHEVLAESAALRALIVRGADGAALETQARKDGMLTTLEDGLYKAARGITSLEEALRAAA